ncbi:MAG: hypothetical protein WAS23_09555, partial [Dokdonella sp.]
MVASDLGARTLPSSVEVSRGRVTPRAFSRESTGRTGAARPASASRGLRGFPVCAEPLPWRSAASPRSGNALGTAAFLPPPTTCTRSARPC